VSGYAHGKNMQRGSKKDRAGRPKGTYGKAPRAPRTGRAPPKNAYDFAEYVLQHSFEALDVLVDVMNNSESDAARVSAAEKILERSVGKAPEHIDATAIKHTEIVYRSVKEIGEELRRRGLPPLSIGHVIANEEPE
jgi:hypothetical protein